jgi:hypothetical protein
LCICSGCALKRDFFLPWNPTNSLDVCSFDVVGLWRTEREREIDERRGRWGKRKIKELQRKGVIASL